MKKRKKRKRNSCKKTLLLILTVFFVITSITAIYKLMPVLNKNAVIHAYTESLSQKYRQKKLTAAQPHNSNYPGIGQETVNNKDGYFTTFTTEETHEKKYLEYKQNGPSSWSQHTYWGGTMEENGCGITALSIILSGYNQNYTPEDLRSRYYPVMDYETLSSELSSVYGIENSGFCYNEKNLSSKKIEEHLSSNRPVLICVWANLGKNRWTTASHYMVLLATDNKGKVYVSNPNGLWDDDKSSGWYDIEEVVPYIVKALFITSY